MFDVNPVSAPGNGIPGAVYEGWLDPTLKVTDYVLLTGGVQWYPSLSGFTQTGLIGVDNRAGTRTLVGTAIFHIDNTPDPSLVKNWWSEALGIFGGAAGVEVFTEVYGQDGKLATFLGGPADNPDYSGLYLSNGEWQIRPNPSYETAVVTFLAPPGGYALLDQVHIATECIPEPTSISLLALGALALFLRKRG